MDLTSLPAGHDAPRTAGTWEPVAAESGQALTGAAITHARAFRELRLCIFFVSQMSDLPDAFRRLLDQAFAADRAERIRAGFAVERQRSFRANLCRTTAEALERELTAAQVPFAKHPLSPWSYTTDRAGEYRLKGSEAYQGGRLYCQSLASQLPALLPSITAGTTILDACAAPGGKTTILAMRGATVVACERARVRYDKLRHTLRLLGCADAVRAHCVDARFPGAAVTSVDYAHVLLDPPCSGSGVLRSDDPRSWAHLVADYEGYIASRVRLQFALGEAVAPAVPSGGSLVYATCSIDPRENEAVVEHLLARFPDLSLVDLSDWRSRFQDATPGLHGYRGHDFTAPMERCLRIDPGVETEGFFVAQLRRA